LLYFFKYGREKTFANENRNSLLLLLLLFHINKTTHFNEKEEETQNISSYVVVCYAIYM
jgi:hypothetical protein